jgi:hypothetical protein
MATYRGDQNKKAYETLPYAPAESGIVKGKVLLMLETLDLAAVGAALTDGDFIKIGSKLPKGARVINVNAILPVDATGVLDFGWEANGAIAADTKGFIDGAANTSAIAGVDAAASAKYKQFTAETQLVSEVITTFTGEVGVLKVAVEYVID